MVGIRFQDKGVVATLSRYGRGADIRFKTDSFVIIGFAPKSMDQVVQMTGRSSRKMGTHESMVMAVDGENDEQALRAHLIHQNKLPIKQGVRVAKVMIGRRRLG